LWEYALIWLPCLIFIPIGIITGRMIQSSDVETWGGHGICCQFWEHWNEEVPCRHPIYQDVQTGTDSNGNPTYTQVYVGDEHPYDVDEHPEHWDLKSTLGTKRVSRGFYSELVARWGNENFHDQHRDYHDTDGDMYQTDWPGDWKTLEPVFETHRWENRTIAAHNLFEFEEIDPEEWPVYEYPPLNGTRGTFICGPYGAWNTELAKINSLMGPEHECIVYICAWKNQPQIVGINQQHYWQGGNKNELIVTFSTDDSDVVQWAHVFSWMDDQTFSFRIRNLLHEQDKLDMDALLAYIKQEIPVQWHRKEFSENAADGGFSYITVSPPTWLLWVVQILSLISSVGVAIFVIMNDFDEESHGLWAMFGNRRRRRSRNSPWRRGHRRYP
ncbi:MAG: hypothetical protein QF805_04980, partial [Pirellulaceae bacterium]|nr:hypothetical protein [Pirellulaceae bacterium]